AFGQRTCSESSPSRPTATRLRRGGGGARAGSWAALGAAPAGSRRAPGSGRSRAPPTAAAARSRRPPAPAAAPRPAAAPSRPAPRLRRSVYTPPLAFDPSGRTLAVLGKSDVTGRTWLQLVDVATRTPLGAALDAGGGDPAAVAFGMGGRQVATVTNDGTLR